MELLIIKYGGEQIEIECDTFEFRTNQVSNWIKLKQGDTQTMIYDIATIKTM